MRTPALSDVTSRSQKHLIETWRTELQRASLLLSPSVSLPLSLSLCLSPSVSLSLSISISLSISLTLSLPLSLRQLCTTSDPSAPSACLRERGRERVREIEREIEIERE